MQKRKDQEEEQEHEKEGKEQKPDLEQIENRNKIITKKIKSEVGET